MIHPDLYRILVPDAPLHRRTDRDVYPTKEFRIRAANANLLSGRPIGPGLQTPSLVSSYAGSIDRILLAFPNFGVSDPSSADAYKSLISALRVGTQFVVVHHDIDRQAIEQWFISSGHSLSNVTFAPFQKYINFTDWAEDAYVALVDKADNAPYLIEPWLFPRSGDALIAEAVQEYTNVTASQAPLMFQGGNCLVGSDFWFLGKDYLSDSVELVASRGGPVSVPDNRNPVDFVRELFSQYVDQKKASNCIGNGETDSNSITLWDG